MHECMYIHMYLHIYIHMYVRTYIHTLFYTSVSDVELHYVSTHMP